MERKNIKKVIKRERKKRHVKERNKEAIKLLDRVLQGFIFLYKYNLTFYLKTSSK